LYCDGLNKRVYKDNNSFPERNRTPATHGPGIQNLYLRNFTEKYGEVQISVTTSGDTARPVHWKRGWVRFITVIDVEAK
jgi:hypothetical protein